MIVLTILSYMFLTPDGRHKVYASEDFEEMSHYCDGSSVTLSTLYRLLIWVRYRYHEVWWSDPGTIDTYAKPTNMLLLWNGMKVTNSASDVCIVHAGGFWCCKKTICRELLQGQRWSGIVIYGGTHINLLL